jgi:hypothetical protein
MHTFLAHKLDKQRLEASIRKGNGKDNIDI